MHPMLEDKESWERSPDDRDPEEDMATSLGMYLTSQAGRDHLKEQLPATLRPARRTTSRP